MTGDKTELRRLNPKLSFNVGTSLALRLMMLHAIRAESPFKEIDNAAMLELASLNFKQIVRESEETEARTA